jgi:hypothetical protein
VLIDQMTEKLPSALRKVEEEQQKIAAVQLKQGEVRDDGALAQRKIAIEAAYNLQVVHTAQDQINYARQIADIESDELQRKLDLAAQEAILARTTGNELDILNAETKVMEAQVALKNQQAQANAKIAEDQRKNTLEWQIQTGLMHTADSAVSKLTSAMSGMILQTKNWQDGFKNAIDSVNKEILDVLIGSALKKLEQALKEAISPSSGGGSATGGGGNTPSGGVFSGSQGGGIFSLIGNLAPKGSPGVPTSGPGSGVGLGGWGAAPAAGGSGEMDELASLFGGMAGGGDITGPTVVGERGWELAIPQVPTTIIPHDASVSMLSSMAASSSGSGRGGDMHFHGGMDFRGAQQGVSNEVNAAIVAAKNEAVRASLNAHREVQRRTPRRPS